MSLRLIIREYLGAQKERGELDALLPDLLLTMKFQTDIRPQVGVAQYGIDIVAKGKDKKDGKQKLWLFIIKGGDIDRNAWNEQNQGVRASLDESKYVFVQQHIPQEYKNLQIVIAVCCGGEMKQNIRDYWNAYVDKESNNNIEYQLWDGDYLTLLVEKYLLSEFLLPKPHRNLLRKSIALINEPEKGFLAFQELLNQLKPEGKSSINTKVRRIQTAHCALRVVYGWGVMENDLNLPFESAERLLLWTWDIVRIHRLKSSRGHTKLGNCYRQVWSTLSEIYGAYFHKISPYCQRHDGLTYGSANEYESALFVFSIMGKMAVIGHNQLHMALITNEQNYFNNAKAVAKCISDIIRFHGISSSPIYDGHIIDITLAILFLSCMRDESTANNWIKDIVGATLYAYQSHYYFPIATDCYDDLMKLIKSDEEIVDELTHLSTLYPILAEWCALSGDKSTYQRIYDESPKALSAMNFQIWYPDEFTEISMYKENATYKSGVLYVYHEMPKTIDEMINDIRKRNEHLPKPENISCIKHSMQFIEFIANRHFRTPVSPYIWEEVIMKRQGK